MPGDFSRALHAFGRRGLAEPIENLHDRGELLSKVIVESIGVAHGKKPLRAAMLANGLASIVFSCSCAGRCHDNAVAELFFVTSKNETHCR